MDRNALKKLVERASNDPEFFHALVFDTESVLKELDYLDRTTKSVLVGTSPEEAIATISGMRSSLETGQDYAP